MRQVLTLVVTLVAVISVVAPAGAVAPTSLAVDAESWSPTDTVPERSADTTVDMTQRDAGRQLRLAAAESRARRIAQQSEGKVDVVFVLDDTGSMGGEIAGAKQNIRGFAEDLEEEGIDAQYGLITFKDDVEVDQELTDDIDTFQDSLDQVRASGGGDAREDNFDALKRATEMDYRSDANRVIVDITDQRAHTANTQSRGVTDLTMSDVIEFMEPYDAYIAVSDENIYGTQCEDPLGPRCGDKRVLAQENLESGSWVDLNQVDQDDESDFGDILETVRGVITDVVDDSDESAGITRDIEYVDAEFNRTVLPPGGTVQVNVTAVNRGETAANYIASFRNDLQLVETQRGRLDAGESVRLSTNITIEDTGDHRLFAAQDYLGTVTVEGLTAAETSARYLEVEYAYLTRLHAQDGTNFEVVATVRSTADTVDEFAITSKRLDGGGAVSETVILEPGEERVIRQSHTVTATPDQTALQEWQVNGDRVGNLTIHPPGDDLPTGVLYTYVTKKEVESGDRYDVVAVVHNGDDSRRNILVNFAREDGDGSSESMLRPLEPGDTERVTYDVIAGDPGTVRWVINDEFRAGTVEIRESE